MATRPHFKVLARVSVFKTLCFTAIAMAGVWFVARPYLLTAAEPVVPATPNSLTSPMPLTDAEKRKLLAALQKAQKAELKALDHRHKLELDELKASQRARRKEWNDKERDARHKFMRANKGDAVRTYIQDYVSRMKALDAIQADEYSQRKNEQSSRRASLIEEQKRKQHDFESALGRGERPAAEFWPTAGR